MKMKRRNFLIALGTIPSLVVSSCNTVIPATIISGKVTDEKGVPIENIPFTFIGNQTIGGSIAGGGRLEETFKIEKKSDKEGHFEFSQSVPQNTIDTYFRIGDVYFPYEKFKIQFKKNGVIIGSNTITLGVYSNSNDSLLLGQENIVEVILTKK